MPMYVTFYSFKGGVGRTLALANVATVLAGDSREPCRVLVWDFDLAAPGLQQVLNCRWKGKTREGFLDYVHHYCTRAEIEPIDRFIYKTDVPNVDILPAGWMGRRYSAKLDQIHWQEIYHQARGYRFIEATKKQIAELKQEYDYVLIDSLTGYSDVGGICVNQLADVVVLLFRLNRQNLEGISKVYRSIQKTSKNADRAVKTVPVISPAWPFASPEADEWTSKVRRVFTDEWPLTIAFDGSLSFGERIISREQSQHPMSPKILDDYRKLSRSLRRLNQQDPQTIYDGIQDLCSKARFTEALDACIGLIRKRPSRSDYWDRLVNTALLSRQSEEAKRLKDRARGLVDEACQAGNRLAYIARYQLRSLFGTKWEEALDDLNKALELDPSRPEIYCLRGTELYQQERYEQAAKDFTSCLDLGSTAPDPSSVLILRADCYKRLGDNDKALEDAKRAAALKPETPGILLHLARVLYSGHRYPEAYEVIKNLPQLAPAFQKARVFSAHVLCALGDRPRAMQELHRAEETGITALDDTLEAAEAYVVVDPKEALRLLDDSKFADRLLILGRHRYKALTFVLRALAAELLDKADVKGQSMRSFEETGISASELHWSFAELKEFLEWAVAGRGLSESKVATLKAMIEHFETSKASAQAV